MIRTLTLLAALATLTASLASVAARSADAPQPRVVSQTKDGKPIILGTMVVTAKALPAE